MCGITAVLLAEKKENLTKYRNMVLESSKLIRHRGPDWSGIYTVSGNKSSIVMGHERLSIIDPYGGSQPIVYKYKLRDWYLGDDYNLTDDELDMEYELVLAVNGEVYNHQKLRNEFSKFPYKSNSDCEVILPLYISYFKNNIIKTETSDILLSELFIQFINRLDGQFSFVLYDSRLDRMIVARDPIGIASLYYGVDKYNNIWVSSEMKGLKECIDVYPFPAGHYLDTYSSFKPKLYYKNSENSKWMSSSVEHCKYALDNVVDYDNINNELFVKLRKVMTDAVDKRLMTDVPFGVLLSGGLDSSLVSSIAVKLVREGREISWGSKIHSFSIGLQGSPDLEKAKVVADYLGTIHHSFNFTIQEGLDAIREVIYHLETYDITTIRASTPMYLLSRKIKAMGVKMVLSGEGADELFGGYLYFLQAPDRTQFHKECARRLQQLSHFDCLRANKSTLAWGVEGRFPFLDNDVINFGMSIEPSLKMNKNIEKWVLRKAFDVKDENGNQVYLPDEILWRQKEQFSDGVGYSWITSLIEVAEKTISDSEFEKCRDLYGCNVPRTKEALMYRKIFREFFPSRENEVKLWIPRTDWNNVGEDPSGRAQISHQNKY